MTEATVDQLETTLAHAADSLRAESDVVRMVEAVSAALLLRMTDERPSLSGFPSGPVRTPLTQVGRGEVGRTLTEDLRGLTDGPDAALNGMFRGFDFMREFTSSQLMELVRVIVQLPAAESAIWSNGTMGRAYGRFLSRFAAGSGRAGEFFTPRSVSELMVRLAEIERGNSVYDPFAGVGGILARAAEHAKDVLGGSREIFVAGQEVNQAIRSIARFNLLLHGMDGTCVKEGDTLTEPRNVDQNGRLITYDRVLTNPPFSLRYQRDEVAHPERMEYGWAPEGKADLLHVQHVLASLGPEGRAVVVLPQGPLFRAGAEAGIRRLMIEDRRIEAVIGIGPNVFHGAAVPACLLVLSGKSRRPRDPHGRILFVNAEHEVVTGRTQNHLEPRHIEKIVRVCRDWAELPGFSRAVTVQEVAEKHYILNIRNYVARRDGGRALLDVAAVLYGGMPRREVIDKAPLFHAFGIDPVALFVERNGGYLDFPEGGAAGVAHRLCELADEAIQAFRGNYEVVWDRVGSELTDATLRGVVIGSREHLLEVYCEQWGPDGPLDVYELSGAFADWWEERIADLDRLDSLGASAEGARLIESLGEALYRHVDRIVLARRQQLVDICLEWGAHYGDSLAQLQERSDAAEIRLRQRFTELGFTQAP